MMVSNSQYGDDNRARDGRFLLELAEAAGARPRPTVNSRFTAFCPFHGNPDQAITRDLSLDVKQGRFNCSACRINDYASGFAARIWKMSRRDAQALIVAGAEPSLQRPQLEHENPYWQNTALLTRAMTHYRDVSNYSHEAVWYLGTLGVSLEQAAQIGLGWCQPDTMGDTIASLRRDGITDVEIEASPLFHRQQREHLAGCIIVPDLDTSGGVTWMVGIPPRGPEPGKPWPHRPPPAKPLRGSRPYLLGLRATETRGQRLYITDDYRLAIRLRANGRAVACTMGRADPATVARHAASARPREIAVICTNDSEARATTTALVNDLKFNRNNVLVGTAAIGRNVINDRSANLSEILEESQPQRAAASRNSTPSTEKDDDQPTE